MIKYKTALDTNEFDKTKTLSFHLKEKETKQQLTDLATFVLRICTCMYLKITFKKVNKQTKQNPVICSKTSM